MPRGPVSRKRTVWKLLKKIYIMTQWHVRIALQETQQILYIPLRFLAIEERLCYHFLSSREYFASSNVQVPSLDRSIWRKTNPRLQPSLLLRKCRRNLPGPLQLLDIFMSNSYGALWVVEGVDSRCLEVPQTTRSNPLESLWIQGLRWQDTPKKCHQLCPCCQSQWSQW